MTVFRCAWRASCSAGSVVELAVGFAATGWTGGSCFWRPRRCVCCRPGWRSVWPDCADSASAGRGAVDRLTRYAQVEVGTGDLLRMAGWNVGDSGQGLAALQTPVDRYTLGQHCSDTRFWQACECLIASGRRGNRSEPIRRRAESIDSQRREACRAFCQTPETSCLTL